MPGRLWLKHVEIMTALAAHGCDPWGKLKQMRLTSKMRSQMRQLQELSRVHRRVYVCFFQHGAWLRSCFVMNREQDGALTGLGFSAETAWYPVKMMNHYTVVCVGGTATNSTISTFEQLAPLPGAHFWRRCRSWSTSSGASCCRWNVSWLFLRRKFLVKHIYT